MGSMGPLKNIFGMMGAPDVPKETLEQGEEKLKKYKIIISSMTIEERRQGKILHESGRVARIAKGSGTTEKDVHALISEFNKMKKVFDNLKNDRGFKKRFMKFG
jgi:signal recognition particle subunit SRP54